MSEQKGNQGVAASPPGHQPSASAADASSQSGVPNAGDTFTIAYPFVRGTYTGYDEEGGFERETWRPGTRTEDVGPEDAAEFADAIGSATFTVVGSYRPGRFPTRVFFTRKFTDPDGRTFGKDRLHIKTLGQFRRLTNRYLEPFGIGDTLPSGWKSARARADEAEAEFYRLLAEYAASGIVAATAGETQSEAARLDERSEQSPTAEGRDAQNPPPANP